MPSFTYKNEEGTEEFFSVFQKITSIGCAKENDISLNHDSVLEHHANVIFDGKDFAFSEVDRSALIRSNGRKKRRGKLIHGDVLTIGEVDLLFSIFDNVHVGNKGVSPEVQSDQDSKQELLGVKKLVSFSEEMMKVRSVKEQLRVFLDGVIAAVHADKGFLIFLSNGEPQIAAARNVEHKDLTDGIRQLSDSVVKKVMETQQPLIVSDAIGNTMFNNSESIMNLQVSSVLCVPLIAAGQMLGLVYVGNDKVANLFDARSLDLMALYASQGALILQNAIILDELSMDRDEIAKELEDRKLGEIVGSCPSVLEVFKKVKKVACTDISVLITGETGTGKELIARQIHEQSSRKEGPFVVVNCGAIPENLMESELFGHVRGAFTGAIATREGKFQQAQKGTLFLDEIGEMPISLQVKLLRALQERVVSKVGDSKMEEVDIRVLSATHRDLEEEIREHRFREDLFYRLNVVNIHSPPLRVRGADIEVLAKFFLYRYIKEFAAKVKGFDSKALQAIRQYSWPGNVRQLENRIKRAVVLSEGSMITPEELDLSANAFLPVVPLNQAKENFTMQYVLEILERNNGNRTKTAKDLDVDPRTIFRYLEKQDVSDDFSA